MESLIAQIWSEYYQLTERDLEFLRIPIRSQFRGIYYGIYCGPLTNQKYDTYYKQGSNKIGDPIDGLDLICMLHDRYFLLPHADYMMIESVKVLMNYGMVKNSFNPEAADRFVKLLKKLFSVYRFISFRKNN